MADPIELPSPIASPPSISEGTLSYERGLLADPKFAEQYPVQHAALKRSFEGAIAGLSLPAASVETRTPQQVLHDRMMGISERKPGDYTISSENTTGIEQTRSAMAAMQLDPRAGSVIAREILANPGPKDPATISKALPLSLPYDKAIADATYALQHAANRGVVAPKATELSARSLALLAIHGARLRQHSQTRPK